MATKKSKPQKRSSAAKSGKTARKSKPTARPKPKPAAKPAKKAVKKAAKPVKKPVKKAPAKAAKKAPAKAPVKKAAAKKAPAKVAAPPKVAAPAKVAAPPKKVAPEKALSPKAQAPEAREAREPRKQKPVVAPTPLAPPAPTPPAEAAAPGPTRRGRKPKQPQAAETNPPATPAAEGEGKVGGLPAIRPYRGTKFGKEKKLKPLRPRKAKPRDRFSKLFAEFETKPVPAAKKKRRLLDEEEEETSFSVIREEMKLQVMSPEQIRAEVLRKFLAGEQVTCPVGCGGIAEIVRVGTIDDGSGEVWIECLSCAQRERFVIAKAKPDERQAMHKAMEDVGEAACPRHARTVVLRRRGRDLVCPECGVLYPPV